jgi:hypothetical protein
VALDDRGQLFDAAGEAIDRRRVLSRQPHAREHRQAHADFRRVQEGDVPVDHARLFEQPDASATSTLLIMSAIGSSPSRCADS